MSDLAKLVHDFRCSKADDMYIEQLAEKTRYYKETQEGVSHMCKAIEDMRKVAQAEKEYQDKVEFAVRLLTRGKDTFEEIADLTGLSIEDIQELAASVNKTA